MQEDYEKNLKEKPNEAGKSVRDGDRGGKEDDRGRKDGDRGKKDGDKRGKEQEMGRKLPETARRHIDGREKGEIRVGARKEGERKEGERGGKEAGSSRQERGRDSGENVPKQPAKEFAYVGPCVRLVHSSK